MRKFKINYNNRIDFIDIGKFIAIIFVVLTHVLQRTVPHYTGTDSWGCIYILMLGVPPFFFLSGIAHRNKKPLHPLGFLYDILKRGFMYFLPFIWFILLRIWLYDQWPDFSKAWDDLMLYPVSGLWVCWILFFISVTLDLGLLISYFYPKLKVLFVSLVLVIGFVVLMVLRNNDIIETDHNIAYDYFIVYSPVFLVGYLAGPYILEIKNNIIFIICLVIGFGSLIPISIHNHAIVTVYFLEESQWMMYLASFCSMLGYFGLIGLIKHNGVRQILGFLGQFTLEMYFLHLMLLKNWAYMNLPNDPAIIWTSIGLFLLCFVNTFGVVLVTYFVPFLHFIMFGRHYSIYKFEDKIFNYIKEFSLSGGKLPNKSSQSAK